MLKYEKKELGKFTRFYKLIGGENKTERMMMYSKILFKNLGEIATPGGKQIIIVNEKSSGGVIFGKTEFIDLAFQKLQENNKEFFFKIVAKETANNEKYSKIAFEIKKENWKVNL